MAPRWGFPPTFLLDSETALRLAACAGQVRSCTSFARLQMKLWHPEGQPPARLPGWKCRPPSRGPLPYGAPVTQINTATTLPERANGERELLATAQRAGHAAPAIGSADANANTLYFPACSCDAAGSRAGHGARRARSGIRNGWWRAPGLTRSGGASDPGFSDVTGQKTARGSRSARTRPAPAPAPVDRCLTI